MRTLRSAGRVVARVLVALIPLLILLGLLFVATGCAVQERKDRAVNEEACHRVFRFARTSTDTVILLNDTWAWCRSFIGPEEAVTRCDGDSGSTGPERGTGASWSGSRQRRSVIWARWRNWAIIS